jgi:filamentous hemagglutinin family protein
MIALGASPARTAWAAPSGGQVAPDIAKIDQSGPQTVINQFANRAAIDWQSFSIGRSESVIFKQPSSASVALNQVVGPNPSEIYGSLQANGHVFLINPAGVTFARGAQVDVAGLVASTLNISNADFMAGRYVFSGGAGAGRVVNEADIRMKDGAYVAFLGNQVMNSGSITANRGSVALAAGEAMVLDFNGDGLLSVKVNAAAAGAKIDHSGVIQADGGMVIMSAQAKNALLDTVLNVEGIVSAKGVVERDGYVYLDGGQSGVTAVSGTLDASASVAGRKGGDIRVLGEYVGLFGHAKLDASGAGGGGTVLVGGDYQGTNPAVSNARGTYVGPDALIKADAIHEGDAGKVIVWADDTTRFYGTSRRAPA